MNKSTLHKYKIVILLPLALVIFACTTENPNNSSSSFNLIKVSFDGTEVTLDKAASSISLRPTIKLIFDADVDASSINNNISLIDNQTLTSVAIQFIVSIQNPKEVSITLSLSSPSFLKIRGQYSLNIRTGLKSVTNENLEEEKIILFNTIEKNSVINLEVEYNSASIANVNNVFTIYDPNQNDLANVPIKLIVSESASLWIVENENEETELTLVGNIINTSFDFSASSQRRLKVISESGLTKQTYRLVFRKSTASIANVITEIRVTLNNNQILKGIIEDNTITFQASNFTLGEDLRNPKITFIDISTFAEADKKANDFFNFTTGADEITITSEDGTQRIYTVTLITTPNDVNFTTYTSSARFGGGINDASFNNSEMLIEVSNVENGVAYSGVLNGVYSTSTKIAQNNKIIFSKADFSNSFSTLQDNETLTFFLEAVGIQSNPFNITYAQKEIYTWQDLQSMRLNLNLHYQLMNNIVFPDNNFNELADDYAFEPIGHTTGFSGRLSGNNKTISNLFINRTNSNNVGLFTRINFNAVVDNVGMINDSITGFDNVGAIAGIVNGKVINCFTDNSNITGNNNVGGLVGNNTGVVLGYFNGSIYGNASVGGLAGVNSSNVAGYSKGTIQGSNTIGGLVGTNKFKVIGYTTAHLMGGATLGGLVGTNENNVSSGVFTDVIGFSAATFSNSSTDIGGLVGKNGDRIYGYWDIEKATTSDAFKLTQAEVTTSVSATGITKITNVSYLQNGYYDTKGTTSSSDDNPVFNLAEFATYFKNPEDPNNPNIKRSNTWPSLNSPIELDGVSYEISINQPIIP